jgi:murein DD-endopeptidase MepM/ murein hydrolase activator NlpD
MADVAEWPASGKIASYTVRPGDTLSEIAEMYGVSVNTIAWANNISAKASLQTGQTLIILPVSGVRHTVVKGETLAILARDYHGDAAEIAQYNGLEDGQLAVGEVVIIPNGELAPAVVKTPAGKPAPKGSTNPYRGGSGPILAGYYQAPLANYVKTQGLHGYNGVDLASRQGAGATVMAAAAGRVIISKSSGYNGGYGQYVVIEHTNGTQTLYGHLSKNLVSAGEPVEQGEPIGLEGSTGRSTGPHVHFEIRGAANPF